MIDTARPPRILLVEDERSIAEPFASGLRREGFEPAIAATADAARELAAEWNPDLVLLDLYMPEMDGFELLSLMQEDERLRTIPVVVMTANDTNEIAANCLSKKHSVTNV
jgi:CheY-like chemotaxis protein